MSSSLSSLFKNERPWANRSWQKSDREQIALVFACDSSINHSQKWAIRSKKFILFDSFSMLSPFLCPRGNRFHCSFILFFIKRAAGAICSFSQVMRSFSRANRSFAFSLKKNKPFTQKTIERIPNPDRRQALYQLSYQGNFNNDVMSSKRLTQHKWKT